MELCRLEEVRTPLTSNKKLLLSPQSGPATHNRSFNILDLPTKKDEGRVQFDTPYSTPKLLFDLDEELKVDTLSCPQVTSDVKTTIQYGSKLKLATVMLTGLVLTLSILLAYIKIFGVSQSVGRTFEYKNIPEATYLGSIKTPLAIGDYVFSTASEVTEPIMEAPETEKEQVTASNHIHQLMNFLQTRKTE
ncbi:cytochrome B pre-mRNA-processing protein [Acrasis kona]|uniref:Cytochrome B pre-mRNA-processing protein n=1 Tax=Acrasis kona TaxID=1008807 RepID=A0AAW2ZP50_9EUKA